MGEAIKKINAENENNNETLEEFFRNFNPTVEEHVKSIEDEVSEVLMGRCPPRVG